MTGAGATAGAGVMAGAATTMRAAPAPILFVITTTDFGGTESFLEQLVAGLDRERFLPAVCSLCPPGRAAQRIAASGVAVETLGMAARPRPHQLLAGAARLARLVKRRRVRLVHGLLYRANVLACAACRLLRRPPVLLWGQHSQIATSESRWAAAAARWSRPAADRVVAVAAAVGESLVAAGRLPRERVTVIANGVDAERFRPGDGADQRRALGLAPGALAVGAAGRLAPEKGLRHLLAAAALARSQGAPIEILLAGDGPERAALGAQAAVLGLAGAVHFLGFQRRLEAVFPAFDVYALPSLEEASPMALLEAMSCALPVVAAAVGGVPEILDQGACGLLVPPADPPALAAALTRLAAQPELRRRLAAAARERVLAAYDLPAMIRRHQDLYQSLLPPA